METSELVKVRRLPAPEEKVESGPLMFGMDWPGTFIRGKDAFFYSVHLRKVLTEELDIFTRAALAGLLDDLQASDCRNNDAFPAWHNSAQTGD